MAEKETKSNVSVGGVLREAFKLATAFGYMLATESIVQGYEDAGRVLDIAKYKINTALSR